MAETKKKDSTPKVFVEFKLKSETAYIWVDDNVAKKLGLKAAKPSIPEGTGKPVKKGDKRPKRGSKNAGSMKILKSKKWYSLPVPASATIKDMYDFCKDTAKGTYFITPKGTRYAIEGTSK